MTDSTQGLPAHAAQVRTALDSIGGFPPDWVPPQEGSDTDVVIIGAGQAGLSIAFGLKRAGISRIRLLDAAPENAQGVWHTRAYMPNLRTPLINPGPELGVPELSLASWYRARHGEAAFSALEKCPTADWAAYLDWFRDTLELPVAYQTRLTAVRPAGSLLVLTLATASGARTLTTRRLILATGLAGSGQPRIPELIRQALPKDRYHHSLEHIDTRQLQGRHIGVIGSSTSAFDMAALALEAGARQVDMLSRRPEIVTIAKFAAAAYPGAKYAHLLPDAVLWQISTHYLDQGSPPPVQSVGRATRHENFHLHLNAPLASVHSESGRIAIRAGTTTHEFDHLLCGTGFDTDLALRPELQPWITQAATWSDRVPEARHSGNPLARFPYLSPGFALQERTPGTAPWLEKIHIFNYAAHIGVARSVGDISSLSKLVPRLVDAIGASLFLEDREAQLARLTGIPQMSETLSREHYAHRLAPPAALHASPHEDAAA